MKTHGLARSHAMEFARCEIMCGDALSVLKKLPPGGVHCVVTSPPYWGLRDYGHGEQLGREDSPAGYVAQMVAVFREVRRVLRDDGTLWLNLGDTYRNSQLCGIPWQTAFALRDDGWRLRSDVIWHKPNPMPSSVRDRCTTGHEYVFMLAKSQRYFFDAYAIREPQEGPIRTRTFGNAEARANGRKLSGNEGNRIAWTDTGYRNRRTVWRIPTRPYRGAHFAVMPPALVRLCIEAGTSDAGCCGECGKPLQRELRRERVPTRPGRDTKTSGNASVEGNRDPLRHVTKTEMIRWKHECDCRGRLQVPCTVLDPFAGSGTTLAVAAELGRAAIGIELNPAYVELVRERINREGAA